MRSAATIALVMFSAAAALATDPPPVEFASEVYPILARRCFQCHDARKNASGLRLDLRRSALAGGESGEPAVVAGDSQQSGLFRRVTSDVEGYRMPPEGPGLSQAEVQLLQRWLDGGASWPDELAGAEQPAALRHWAFTPPQRPALPEVIRREWPANPIDHFVLARLEAEGVEPSATAERETLVRRLYLDLIGLPPSTQQLDSALADAGSDAYERLVERLLASPHFGERWGRVWLDAARYADSDGFEKDKPRQVWFYRDWVIAALNEDMPYDQFIIRQIAGDLLPGATQADFVATGFLRNSMINEEGGIDPEQFRMEAMFDRMDAIGKSILGLTIQCAQCHDHKYDPLTQLEYYRLFAFLNNAHEANISVYTAEEQTRRSDIFRQINRLEDDLRHRNPNWLEQMLRWEEGIRDNQPEWTILRPNVDEDSTGGQKYLPMEDGSFLAQGYAPTKHRVKMTVDVPMERITALRLELLTDPNLPRGGPGRSIEGTAALTEVEVEAAALDSPDQVTRRRIASATADFNPPRRPLKPYYDDRSKRERVTGPIEYAVDGNGDTAWGTDAGPALRNQDRQAVFVFDEPIESRSGVRLTIYLAQNHGGWNSDDNQNHNLGRFRLAVTSADAARADPVPRRVRQIMTVPPDERTEEQLRAEFRYWRTTVDAWAEMNQAIERLWEMHPEGTTQLVFAPRETPRHTFVLARGDFLKPLEEVTPGTPEFLHGLPDDQPRSRLTLAKWLVDPQCPTTARAIVNRIWQAYFGNGLCSTPEDLGTQSEPPSHPELLDWLAVELIDSGWSLKHIHRLIVTSKTYRQSSHVTQPLLERDPYNRLLARGARFRVDAEVVRDIALKASGLWNRRVGGPSTYPPLPEFMLKPPVSYGPKVWHEDKGADRYRRALYTFRYRSVPYPMLQAFDAPNGDFSCVRRSRSNTPLQALVTLNEPIFVECAKGLARRILRQGGSDDRQRIEWAFRTVVSRFPTEHELAELSALLTDQRHYYQQHTDAAQALAAGDPQHLPDPPHDADPATVAVWTVVARVLLNLDETITRQ